MTLFHPIKLKDLILENNIVYSPLAGCSDLPFRKMVRKYSNSLVFCEMTKGDAIAFGDEGTFSMLSYPKGMHPIGAQVCSAKKDIAKNSAIIFEQLGFDVVDLNCGCPVDKVTKDGSGSALLKYPEKIGEILYEMTKAVSIPVTVKIRAGWDEENICAKEVTKIAEQAGASAIFIHGRTRKQGYKGPANWDYIKDACDQKRSILVFANGDIMCKHSATKALETTGADGVLVSRVTMGKPFISEEIMTGKQVISPLDLLSSHIEEILAFQTPRKVLSDIRRVACWYLRDQKEFTTLRKQINKAKSVNEILETLSYEKA